MLAREHLLCKCIQQRWSSRQTRTFGHLSCAFYSSSCNIYESGARCLPCRRMSQQIRMRCLPGNIFYVNALSKAAAEGKPERLVESCNIWQPIMQHVWNEDKVFDTSPDPKAYQEAVFAGEHVLGVHKQIRMRWMELEQGVWHFAGSQSKSGCCVR